MNTLLIDFSHNIIKTAYLENGNLVELLVDSKNNMSIVGNIYAGIIKSILPNQFVFIDIGMDKNAFLSLSDHREHCLFENSNVSLKVGNQIIVQVLKEGSQIKGPLVTTEISISSKCLALYTSDAEDICVSKKIENVEERRRLKSLGKQIVPKGYGIIFRTLSKDKQEQELTRDLSYLKECLDKISKYSKYVKAPACLLNEENFLEKNIKIFTPYGLDLIVVNNEIYVKKIHEILKKINIPTDICQIYNGALPLFNEYFVESEIEKVWKKKVWLKSGGFIIIEETEACVVIDVNSGKFSGKKDIQKSIMKTNIEAANEISRQIRLRNLSGAIIIDFIDIRDDLEKQHLIDHLKNVVKKDRISVNVLGMAHLGMVQMTRKKTREPISATLLKKCSYCGGTGKMYCKEEKN